jgi:hypothetical protein
MLRYIYQEVMLDDIIVAEESGRSVLSVKKILDLFLPFH